MNRAIKLSLGCFLFLFAFLGFSIPSFLYNTNQYVTTFHTDSDTKHAVLKYSGLFSSAYAQENQKAEDGKEDEKSIVEILNDFLQVLYLILWPLLFVAGLAVDNSLVYGSIFGFDTILWKVWVMLRDMANFSLFFIALYFIIKGLISNKSSEITGVVKKLLISGILIQASWFLMGAIIDISTVAIYGIGGLPAQIVSKNDSATEVMKTPILQRYFISYAKKDKSEAVSYTYYGYGNKKIPSCKTYYSSSEKRAYIVGRYKFPPLNDEKKVDFYENGEFTFCSDGRYVYIYNEDSVLKRQSSLAKYNDEYKNIINTPSRIGSLIAGGTAAVPLYGTSNRNCGTNKCGVLPYNADFFTGGNTLENVLKYTKGKVGVFITLYSSLLGYSDFSTGGSSPYLLLSNFLLKVVFALLLFIPLLVMVIVLLLRVGVLWLAIIFFPFLIIKWVFFDGKELGGKFVSKYFDKWNLLNIIFAPVVMVFALSLSIIFMQSITKDISKNINNSEFGVTIKNSYISEQGANCMDVLGLVSLCNKDPGADAQGINFFSDFMEKVFALAIMWFLLFAAIKMNKIGEDIGGTIQKLTHTALGNIPIIPIKGGVGWNAFKSEILQGKAIDTVLNAKLRTDQQTLKRWNSSLFGNPASASWGNINDVEKANMLYAYHQNGNNIQDTYSANQKILNRNNIEKDVLQELLEKETKNSLSKEQVLESYISENGDETNKDIFYQNSKYIAGLSELGISDSTPNDKQDQTIREQAEKQSFGAIITKENVKDKLDDLKNKKEKINDSMATATENEKKNIKTDLDKLDKQREYLEKRKKVLISNPTV